MQIANQITNTPNLIRIQKTPPAKFIKNNFGMLIGLILLGGFLSISTESFLTETNLMNVLRQISMNAIIAFGMTKVILIGGIDLSVGSILAASGCITVSVIVKGAPMPVGLLAGLLCGGLLGMINGVLVSKGKMPAFIVTLGMMTMARGLAYVYTGGRPTRVDSELFSQIGNGYVGSIPIPVIIMIAIFIISVLLLQRTKFGRNIYAMGGNREAALFAGINISKIEIIVYTLSGILAGAAGIISASRMTSGQPIAGQGMELDAIAAVVLGGTSFTGGVGTVGGTLIGALIIGVLNNGLNLLHVSFYWQLIIKGMVIVFAVYIDTLKKAKK